MMLGWWHGTVVPTLLAFLRRVAAPLWLVRVRLAARAVGVALVVVGIAAGAGILAAVLAGSLVAEDRSLARALDKVPPADAALRVAYVGIPRQGADYRVALDPAVRRALAPLASGQVVGVMQLRQTRFGGALVDLGAIDGMKRWIRLKSGRLPRPCSPSLCEVLQIGGTGPIPNEAGNRIVRVGTGTLTSSVPFGRLAPTSVSRASVGVGNFALPSQPPFLLAEGVAGLSAFPELSSIYRGYSWVMPLDPASVHPWNVDGFLARVTRARSALEVRNYLFDLTAPDDQLRAARESSRVAGRRLLLIGGEAAALLLAFAVLAAASMRRDVEAAWRRLTWFGARRWQRFLLVGAESTALAVAGTALGWGIGAAAAAAVADRAGSPPRAVLANSVASSGGIVLALLLGLAAALVLVTALRASPLRLGSLSLSAADAAAAGALVTIAVILVRGKADARELAAEGGTGTLLLLLPALATFVFAILFARLLTPALRLLERVGRRGGVSLRLAALSLARNPGHAVIAVVFLVISLGLALFAAVYRATLDRGQSDQAAFAVPLDFTLREDLSPTGLVTPLQAAPLKRYRQLGGDETFPVVRQRGSVSRLAGSPHLTLLGVPSNRLTTLRWRADFSTVPIAELGRRIRPSGPIALRGPRLPPAGTEIALPLVAHGDGVGVTASVLTPREDFVQVDLGVIRGDGRQELHAEVPTRGRGGRIVAFTFSPLPRSIESGEPAEGSLTLGRVTARGPSGTTTLVSGYEGWVGVNGISHVLAGNESRLGYFVTDLVKSRFRPRQPADAGPIPVIASPRLAAAAGPGGTLVVQLAGPKIRVRIVASARRFPSILGADFVVGDQGALRTALNTDSPGTGIVNEVWLGASSDARSAAVESALRRPPFERLAVQSRRALAAELESDPLARGSLAALAVAAAAAAALALVGLLLVIAGDLSDERGELFDLEAQGAGPAALRRHMRLRILALSAFGLFGGLVTGAVLSALVVDLVLLTANATAPEPPLLLTVDWRLTAVALVAFAVVALLLVAAATWRAFRSPFPGRATEQAG
jgi:hypothetical protein